MKGTSVKVPIAVRTLQALAFLAGPRLLCGYLAYFMLLLTYGTLQQTQMGIFPAIERYFSSLFFVDFIVPLPGGATVLGLIALSLVARSCQPQNWRGSAKLGSNMMHLGLLLLLIGAFLQHVASEEGNMVIEEGRTSNVIHDYHDLELVVAGQQIYAQERIEGLRLSLGGNDYEVTHFCAICALQQGRLVTLNKANPPQDNRAGIVLTRVSDTQSWIVRERDAELLLPQSDQAIALRRVQSTLPFALMLKDFERVLHPGTEVAKSYASEVQLQDGSLRLNERISMNEPLRYQGYTFFQASFLENSASDTTVLAVVRDRFRLMPYLASMLLALGLLLHLFRRLPQWLTR